VLTYRTGAAGAPSAAKAMGEHLLQQTLAPDMAVRAEYYQQGMSPPSAGAAAASRYVGTAPGGRLPMDAELDDIVAREMDRLDESARDIEGKPIPRTYAAEQGLNWDSLDAGRKIGLLSQGPETQRN